MAQKFHDRRSSSTGILGFENGKAQGFQAWEMEWAAQGFTNMGIERHGALSMGQGVMPEFQAWKLE